MLKYAFYICSMQNAYNPKLHDYIRDAVCLVWRRLTYKYGLPCLVNGFTFDPVAPIVLSC